MTTSARRDPERHQFAAVDLIEQFHGHDAGQLAILAPDERERQLAARAVLAEYVDELWTGYKRRGLRPADHPEQYNAVAAMRDLTHHLAYGVGTAESVTG